MEVMLKDCPVLKVQPNGSCEILEFHRLPFGLRREDITFPEFVEWASNRTLSIGRSYAKEILNSLRLSQTNRYAVCKACRGLSLEDGYWIRQDGDDKCWDEVNLFRNEISLFLTDMALSGSSSRQKDNRWESLFEDLKERVIRIHTPELTTLGVSAKGWIRGEDGLYLHKVGKYEIPASQILEKLEIPHIAYELSGQEEILRHVSPQRMQWIDGVGEKMVKSRLFTSEEISMVTFEEFSVYCGFYGLDPYEEAARTDRRAYLKMQVADYILNNDDRHGQNWGFFMENSTGRLTGLCPLFDHDHAFSSGAGVMSQTVREAVSLEDAAKRAWRELRVELSGVLSMDAPVFLEQEKWERVLERCGKLMGI